MGVMCGQELVQALLFADDIVILPEVKDKLMRGLGVLEEWCSEWAMKVNADMWSDACKEKGCRGDNVHIFS